MPIVRLDQLMPLTTVWGAEVARPVTSVTARPATVVVVLTVLRNSTVRPLTPAPVAASTARATRKVFPLGQPSYDAG